MFRSMLQCKQYTRSVQPQFIIAQQPEECD